MNDASASEQIDSIIAKTTDWRGTKLSQLRTAILATNPIITEEVKWKKPSRPEGVAVWSSNGNLCIADILKNVVRLTFPKGAQIEDPHKIFNSRLDSKGARAIDFTENDSVNTVVLQAIVAEAILINNGGK